MNGWLGVDLFFVGLQYCLVATLLHIYQCCFSPVALHQVGGDPFWLLAIYWPLMYQFTFCKKNLFRLKCVVNLMKHAYIALVHFSKRSTDRKQNLLRDFPQQKHHSPGLKDY